VARALGQDIGEISPEWYDTAEVLKSKPGKTEKEELPGPEGGVFPVLHCVQEIPCDPCTAVCPRDLIKIEVGDIRGLPVFLDRGDDKGCTGCEKCLAICPGLAVTLVDFRKDAEFPTVSISYEFLKESLKAGERVMVQDMEGAPLGDVEVVGVKAIKANDRTVIIKVRAPKEYAKRIAGIRIQPEKESEAMDRYVKRTADDTIICRCERVMAGEIRDLIRGGVRDINQLKAVTRTSMGSCGAKTCTPLIHRLFREEGVPESEIVDQPKRPLFMEVPLGVFAGVSSGEDDHGPK
jgi:sarcosine oxidase subunit alpha